MDNETMDECDCPEGTFEMNQEVGVRMQCLHRVLDCGDWNLATPSRCDAAHVIEIADHFAAYVLNGTKPDPKTSEMRPAPGQFHN